MPGMHTYHHIMADLPTSRLILKYIHLSKRVNFRDFASRRVTSYTTTWKYLKDLTVESRYLEVVRGGHWIWAYDNLNITVRIRHEREGKFVARKLSIPGLITMLLPLIRTPEKPIFRPYKQIAPEKVTVDPLLSAPLWTKSWKCQPGEVNSSL